MNIDNDSLQNQKTAIAEMKNRHTPVTNMLSGNEITALPNVYAGWLDSELMCEVLDIPKGSKVLDLCTGTGVIAIKAAQLGAKDVIAVDLNPEAVKSAILNKNKLGLQQIEVREGSLFEPVIEDCFDVIIINPPYINHEVSDKTEICFWDAGNTVTKKFFEEYQSHLNPGGSVYLGWGDFADMDLLDELTVQHNVHLDLLGSKVTPSGQETFLAYKIVEN